MYQNLDYCLADQDNMTESDYSQIAKYRVLTTEEQKKYASLIAARLYQEDLAKFRQVLKDKCLKLKEIGSDGNCLFRAIAD